MSPHQRVSNGTDRSGPLTRPVEEKVCVCLSLAADLHQVSLIGPQTEGKCAVRQTFS